MVDGQPPADERPEVRAQPALRETLAALALTSLLAFAIVFAEWLFLVTMPSFLRSLAPVLRLETLFVRGLALTGVAIAVALAAALAALELGSAGGRGARPTPATGPIAELVVLQYALPALVVGQTSGSFQWQSFFDHRPGRRHRPMGVVQAVGRIGNARGEDAPPSRQNARRCGTRKTMLKNASRIARIIR